MLVTMAPPGAPAVTDAFRAIAHPVRRQIAVELASGEKAVGELAEHLPISRSAVSQHLRVMFDVGLVSQEWVGRENRYRLHADRLDEVRQWLSSLDASWAAAMTRLGEHLERIP
jgi:DNA-binding transcriptional ArsR family regulator